MRMIFVSHMRPLVYRECGPGLEAFATLSAPMRALVGVCQQVCGQRAPMRKQFATNAAPVWPITYVDSSMRCEVALGGKLFAAVCASVGALASVRGSVRCEVQFARKTFAALATLVWSLAGVYVAQVRQQVGVVRKTLVTNDACIRALTRVDAHVSA